MAATVLIREKNGAGETPTDKTSGTVRLKVADNATVDNNDPIVIPSSGQNYSMEKVLRLHIGGTGPDVQIEDLEFYMDGANGFGTGVKLWASNESAYTQPGIPDNANDPPEGPVGASPEAAMVDAFSYTSGSPLSLGAGPYSSINTDMGDYLYLVMEAESTATQGATPSETATFGYNEI